MPKSKAVKDAARKTKLIRMELDLAGAIEKVAAAEGRTAKAELERTLLPIYLPARSKRRPEAA